MLVRATRANEIGSANSTTKRTISDILYLQCARDNPVRLRWEIAISAIRAVISNHPSVIKVIGFPYRKRIMLSHNNPLLAIEPFII